MEALCQKTGKNIFAWIGTGGHGRLCVIKEILAARIAGSGFTLFQKLVLFKVCWRAFSYCTMSRLSLISLSHNTSGIQLRYSLDLIEFKKCFMKRDNWGNGTTICLNWLVMYWCTRATMRPGAWVFLISDLPVKAAPSLRCEIEAAMFDATDSSPTKFLESGTADPLDAANGEFAANKGGIPSWPVGFPLQIFAECCRAGYHGSFLLSYIWKYQITVEEKRKEDFT